MVIYKVVFSINPSNNKKEGSVTVYKPKKIIDLTYIPCVLKQIRRKEGGKV